MNDLSNTRPCSTDETDSSGNGDYAVSGHHESLLRPAGGIPIGAGLDQGRKSKSKRRQAESAKKRDEQLKVGDCYSEQNCENNKTRQVTGAEGVEAGNKKPPE